MRERFAKLVLALPVIMLTFTLGIAQETSEEQDVEFEYNFTYREAVETSGATSYIFTGEAKPPLTLGSSDLGSSVEEVGEVNEVLGLLGLPPVSSGVPESEFITGFRSGRGIYEWNPYSQGSLTISRALCERTPKTKGFFSSLFAASEKYDCIWKVTVGK